MHVSDAHVSEPDRATHVRTAVGHAVDSPMVAPLTIAVVTALGAALRLIVAHQSLFADELSTRWIISTHGLSGVVSTVRTDVEITPPLYFVASWLTTRIDLTPELLRAPSLIAGIAAIPLIYLIGLRTVGRRAAVVAATLTAFSPFMIYYSAEARGYELVAGLVMLSTLAMLVAIDDGRARWWVAYGACSCAAVYTHYTSVFALAGQLLWLLCAHPQARRAAVLANAGAIVAFLPWLSGLRGDLDSRTTDILSALQPFTFEFVRISLEHWALGFPYPSPSTRLPDLPGVVALVLLGVALVVAVVGAIAARPRFDRRLALVLVLAASVPIGEALASAVSSNVLGTRNLAAAWPAFALALAAVLVAGGRRLGVLASILAVAAFAVGGAKMLETRFARPDARAVAAFIDRNATSRDAVIDGTLSSPAGVPGALDASFSRPHRVFALGRFPVRYNPFRLLGPPPTTAEVVHRAVAAADGRRVFLVLNASRFFVVGAAAPARDPTRDPQSGQAIRQVMAALPRSYRLVDVRSYRGFVELVALTFADRA
jgi:hypothetical protein